MKTKRINYFTIVEAIVYCSILLVIMTITILLFNKGVKKCSSFTKAGDSIIKVNNIGDQWRDHIRNAENITQEKNILQIQQNENTCFYKFNNSNLEFKSDKNGKWKILYNNLKKCEFLKEKRDVFTTWTMNIELQTKKAKVKVKPCFSFISVEGFNKRKN